MDTPKAKVDKKQMGMTGYSYSVSEYIKYAQYIRNLEDAHAHIYIRILPHIGNEPFQR